MKHLSGRKAIGYFPMLGSPLFLGRISGEIMTISIDERTNRRPRFRWTIGMCSSRLMLVCSQLDSAHFAPPRICRPPSVWRSTGDCGPPGGRSRLGIPASLCTVSLTESSRSFLVYVAYSISMVPTANYFHLFLFDRGDESGDAHRSSSNSIISPRDDARDPDRPRRLPCGAGRPATAMSSPDLGISAPAYPLHLPRIDAFAILLSCGGTW